MKIKVYNENGTIKVTKLVERETEHGREEIEQVMFGNIQQGQIAEIEIIATTSYQAFLGGVSMQDKPALD